MDEDGIYAQMHSVFDGICSKNILAMTHYNGNLDNYYIAEIIANLIVKYDD